MSLLEVAEASSPGPGKVEPRSRLSPFPKAAAFAGGAISEGEEEEEDDQEVRTYVCSTRACCWGAGGERANGRAAFARKISSCHISVCSLNTRRTAVLRC